MSLFFLGGADFFVALSVLELTVYQAVLELTEIYLPLPLPTECWDQRCIPPLPIFDLSLVRGDF